MSGQFRMDDYVDVAERIREFSTKYPDGSLQSELTLLEGGWLCKAYAYRSGADDRPGIGHAFEPVPGKTPYTRDSEAMNAETSAWGRAIVALGFNTKKIASAQEVRARQEASSQGGTAAGGGDGGAAAEAPAPATADGVFVFPSGKYVGKTLVEVPNDYLTWYVTNGPRQDVKDAILAFNRHEQPVTADPDIPF